MGVLCICLVGDLPYTLRDKAIPLVRSKGYPPRSNDLTRSPAVTDCRKKKRSLGCLGHVVSGMVYSVVRGGLPCVWRACDAHPSMGRSYG